MTEILSSMSMCYDISSITVNICCQASVLTITQCPTFYTTNNEFTKPYKQPSLTLILRRSRTGMVWFYTSTSNKRAARPKLYTKSLTRDSKRMYSRLTLVRISINLWAPRFFYIGTGVSLLFRELFLYI